jgi:hypothetical protein
LLLNDKNNQVIRPRGISNLRQTLKEQVQKELEKPARNPNEFRAGKKVEYYL